MAAQAGTPARSDDKSLDQNELRLLGEELTYPPDVVEDESAGAGCRSDVGSEGQLVSPSRGHHRGLNADGEVVDGRFHPRKEVQLGLVKVKPQSV